MSGIVFVLDAVMTVIRNECFTIISWDLRVGVWGNKRVFGAERQCTLEDCLPYGRRNRRR